jgi:hypothetical protein
MIPVEKARRSVTLLEGSGARVTYCESDGGYKVSGDCFKWLRPHYRKKQESSQCLRAVLKLIAK